MEMFKMMKDIDKISVEEFFSKMDRSRATIRVKRRVRTAGLSLRVDDACNGLFASVVTESQGNWSQVEAIQPIMPVPHQHHTNLSTQDHNMKM